MAKPDDNPSADQLETRQLLKQCIAAQSALSALNTTLQMAPNRELWAELLTLIAARDAMEADGMTLSIDRLCQFDRQLRSRVTNDEAELSAGLDLRDQLLRGPERWLAQPPTVELALELVSTLPSPQLSIAAIARIEPDTESSKDRNQDLKSELLGWEMALQPNPELDPLIRLALADATLMRAPGLAHRRQRSRQLLGSLYLVQADLLTIPGLCLIRFLDQSVAAAPVAADEQIVWQEWLHAYLSALTLAAEWSRQRCLGLLALHAQTDAYIEETFPRLHSEELVRILFTYPCCRIEHLVEAGIARRQTASEYLRKLSGAGILYPQKVGRERVFQHLRLLGLLRGRGHRFQPYPVFSSRS